MKRPINLWGYESNIGTFDGKYNKERNQGQVEGLLFLWKWKFHGGSTSPWNPDRVEPVFLTRPRAQPHPVQFH